MQSKISFCNGPVFRKNLSRFAPAWGLYTLALLLAFFLMGDSGLEYWFSANIATSMGFMGIVNLGYGALTAMLLFGDLTNPKLCNGLHALPLRRETWFFTNAVSGIFFNLIPTVIAVIPAVVASTFSAMESGWQIPLYWLAAVNLEYGFFFGLAVLCMFLSGSRIGAAVIYGIVNFLAVLAFYAAEIIYVPHLPGVVAQLDGFLPICPVAQLADMTFVDTENIKEFLRYNLDGSEIYQLNGTFTLSGDWWYLGVIAGVGAVLLLLSLVLYRKRKLECAGDLMATKVLEIPFLVLFSVTAGCMLQLGYVAFNGYNAYGSTTLLWAGLAIGWFAGQMLLKRSAHVFRMKSFLGLAVLAAAMGASLLLNSLDPFGIARWVPNVNDVKSAKVQLSYMYSVTLDTPEEIAEVITLHSIGVTERQDGKLSAVNRPVELEEGDGTVVTIEYKMKDGSLHTREYFILIDSEAGNITRRFFSSLEGIFSEYFYAVVPRDSLKSPEGLLALADRIHGIDLYGVELPAELLTEENMDALLHAILTDMEEGNLVQHLAFHPDHVLTDESGKAIYRDYTLCIRIQECNIYLDIYSDTVHTLAWMEENGLVADFLNQQGLYTG